MCSNYKRGKKLSERSAIFPLALFIMLVVLFACSPGTGAEINFSQRLVPPSALYWFGTDWLGRDQFARVSQALLLSLQIGSASAFLSAILAFVMAVAANVSNKLGWFVQLWVDAFLSIPHLLLLIILVQFLGGGVTALISAVAISHWPRLTRILCDEISAVKKCHFVQLSSRFGQSRISVLIRHIIPFILPHWLIGFLLLVPHTLLHVAGLTFLGFGLEPTTPSMGILLSEASRYMITGHWWLALFPGLVLLLVLLLLSSLSQRITNLIRFGGV